MMRKIIFSMGTCLGIALGAPAWAQIGTTQNDLPPSMLNQIQNYTGQASRPDSGSGAEVAPTLPTLQDIRSPLTTILTRPAGGQTGAGAAGQGALTSGARLNLPSVDPLQRLREFEFDQLREEVQAEQKERNDFQKFVMQSTGRDLPIFGQNLFRAVPTTFA